MCGKHTMQRVDDKFIQEFSKVHLLNTLSCLIVEVYLGVTHTDTNVDYDS